MPISDGDVGILRDLAKRVARVASLPIMAERRAMWARHNSLQRVRPMILVFPEGSWGELLPQSVLECEGEQARKSEWSLRSRLYHHEHLHDDTVIEREWIVGKAIHRTGWGLEPKHIPSPEARGAWKFDPVIHEPADLQKLHFPEVTHDEAETARRLDEAQELLGDILEVRLKGVTHVSFHLMNVYTGLRGLEETMVDMATDPAWVHDAMAFLEEGHRRLIQQYIDLNLLSLNNDSTYNSTGGNGYTDELPKPGFDPEHVRPSDMWASAEAQELAQVSPEMHDEFSMQYEKRLLEPFGLTGYGCCEDLTRKLDDVLTIPHIRRVSVAPSANVDRCAEKLQSGCIFSWKPQPSHLVGDLDTTLIRRYIQHTLEVTRDCVVEMVLKDTHTCQHHPERFTIWTGIARDLAARY